MIQPTNLTILGVEYTVVDVLEHVSMADSFVLRNKIGSGHGEAKLYIGSRGRMDFYKEFFNNFINIKGCFLKLDLDAYLDAAKFEYEEKEQGYASDITPYWNENKQKVLALSPIEYFDIDESPAGGDGRFYLKCPIQPAFKVFRRVILPVITYVSILKLKRLDTDETLFYFRPFLDYFYDKRNHIERIKAAETELENESIPETEKKTLRNARVGQGIYRTRIIEEFPAGCLITQINDERILIASHIKPWVDSNDEEKISRYNGLLLSPTYDRLFDQGFITFQNDGVVKTSPYISPLNWRKLNLQDGQHFNLKHYDERAIFLEYHRKNIFKGITT